MLKSTVLGVRGGLPHSHTSHNLPSRVQKEAVLPLMSYTHVAPTELKAQAFAMFLKVFDLLNMLSSEFRHTS